MSPVNEFPQRNKTLKYWPQQWCTRMWGTKKTELHPVCLIPFCIIDMILARCFLNNWIIYYCLLPQRVPDMDKKTKLQHGFLFCPLGRLVVPRPFAFEPWFVDQEEETEQVQSTKGTRTFWLWKVCHPPCNLLSDVLVVCNFMSWCISYLSGRVRSEIPSCFC